MLVGTFGRGVAGDQHLPELRDAGCLQAAEQAVGIGEFFRVLPEVRLHADTALAVVEVGYQRLGAQAAGFFFGDQETDFLIIAVVDRGSLGSGFAGYLYTGRDERQVGGQYLVGKHLSPATVAADLAERQSGVAHPGGVRHADGIVDFVAAPFLRGHDAAVAVTAGDAGRRVDRQGAGIVTGTAAAAYHDSRKCQRMPIGFEAGFKDQAARRGDADIFEHELQV